MYTHCQIHEHALVTFNCSFFIDGNGECNSLFLKPKMQTHFVNRSELNIFGNFKIVYIRILELVLVLVCFVLLSLRYCYDYFRHAHISIIVNNMMADSTTVQTRFCIFNIVAQSHCKIIVYTILVAKNSTYQKKKEEARSGKEKHN